MTIAEQVAALEREVAELRAKLAERDATIAKLVGALPQAATAPAMPPHGVFKRNDHGGMCACPQCCPPTLVVYESTVTSGGDQS